jgi:hypothetical protein
MRLVKRMGFLHSGQVGVSVAPKLVGIGCSFLLTRNQLAT